ncbi:MAG TPA: asparagine synthase C-terminal domain-containing protein [Lysobacter sp.]
MPASHVGETGAAVPPAERTQLLVSPFYGTPDVSDLEVHSPSLDEVSLADLLRNGFVYPPYSIYENVRLFSCGFDPSQDLFEEAHYQPIFRDSRQLHEQIDERHDWVGEYHDRLCASLRTATENMRAPWLLQSGGKDSTSLAIAASDARPDTVCLTYLGGQEENEVDSARQVATQLGLRHEALVCDVDRAYERYLALVPRMKLLTADFALLSYADLATEISRCGGDGILDGMGSDVYLGVPVNWAKRVLRMLAMSVHLPQFLHEAEWLGSNFKLAYLISTLQMNPFERGFPGSRFTDAEVDALFGRKISGRSKERLSRFIPAFTQASGLEEQLSITLDIMSCAGGMAKGLYTSAALSLPVRYPYCDRPLRDWLAWKVPPELRMDTRKGISKVLVREHIGRRFENLPYVQAKGSFRFNLRELARRRFDHVYDYSLRLRDVLPGAPAWLERHRQRLDNKYDASKFYLLAVVLPWLDFHSGVTASAVRNEEARKPVDDLIPDAARHVAMR